MTKPIKTVFFFITKNSLLIDFQQALEHRVLKFRPLMLLFAGLCLSLINCTASAENVNKCSWSGQGGDLHRTYNLMPPSYSLKVNQVSIGSVMAEVNIGTKAGLDLFKCPMTIKIIKESYTIQGALLEEGFTNVYKTGIPGIGIRLADKYGNTLPKESTYWNAAAASNSPLETIKLEIIRTARGIAGGDTKINFNIQLMIEDWNPAEININGLLKLQVDNYFSGCAGANDINIPMGKIAIANIGKETKNFNLDVICSGMPAGTKLPVRVYFEGDSPGAGRLNLEPGGAEGVEISLKNDRGSNLLFYKNGSTAMTWIQSEPLGELYRLPVIAGYINKASQKVTAGRANATLNYILEYN